MNKRFRDRADAGRRLAEKLTAYAHRDDVIVLGLPRGGVPVAHEVARALNAPLDVFVVRKLGVPWHEELAMGAIASGGVELLNQEVIEMFSITEDAIARVARQEQEELERRERQYRGTRAFPDLRDKTVIVVDDGLATGASMRVAVEALRHEGAARIVVAVPVAAPETCESFRPLADDVVCAEMPRDFIAVGQWYEDFSPTSDQEVHDILEDTHASLRR